MKPTLQLLTNILYRVYRKNNLRQPNLHKIRQQKLEASIMYVSKLKLQNAKVWSSNSVAPQISDKCNPHQNLRGRLKLGNIERPHKVGCRRLHLAWESHSLEWNETKTLLKL